MGKKVSIDQLADAVNEQLQEYNKLSAKVVKAAVTKAGNAVKKDIGANAPKKSGRYAKSWRTKKTKETSTELQVTVYSRPGICWLISLSMAMPSAAAGGCGPSRILHRQRKRRKRYL